MPDSLGYNVDALDVAAVLEPETWAMMLTGLGVLGLAAWRRRAFLDSACQVIDRLPSPCGIECGRVD